MNNYQDNWKQGAIAWFASNPVAANLLMVIILVLGIVSALSIRIEAMPSIPADEVSIDVEYLSGSAKQAEEGITVVIEDALQGVSGIMEITSSSTETGASIAVVRQDDRDLETFYSDIKSAVDAISNLPDGAKTPVISKQSDDDPSIWVNIYGDATRQELQDFSEQLKSALLQQREISKINKKGWRTPEISIEVNESLLQYYGLSLDDLAQKINSESFSSSSGELRSKEQRIFLKGSHQSYDKQEFAELILLYTADNREIRLKDVATIHDGYEEFPNVLSRFNGKPSIQLEILSTASDDVVKSADATNQLVQQWIDEGRIPQGIEVKSWWSRSDYMQDRLALMVKNCVIGVALVMLVLSLFLAPKVAFYVGISLPVCFAGALIMMSDYVFALTINELTTFGFIIVLGILVDDGVVIGESISSQREKESNPLKAAIIGTKRVATPTVYGVLTTIAAFYPLSFIDGKLGKIFGQFALVAVACMIFSLISSKFILPAHLSNLKKNSGKKASWFSKLQQKNSDAIRNFASTIYQPMLERAISYRYAVLGLFICFFILVIGLVQANRVKIAIFPEIPSSVLQVNYVADEQVGYGATHQQSEQLELAIAELNQQWLEQYPGYSPFVESFYSSVSDDKNGVAYLELSTDKDRPLNSVEIGDALRERLQQVPGIKTLQVRTDDDFGEAEFEIKLLSDNLQLLVEANQFAMEQLQQIEGVVDLETDLLQGQPEISFALTALARNNGITSAALAQQIQQAFYGIEAQSIQKGKDEVKVRVRYPKIDRTDITSLQQAKIRTPDGRIFPLPLVAEIVPGSTISTINHVNSKKAVTVSSGIDKTVTSPEAVIENVSQQLKQQFQGQDLTIIEAGEAAEASQSLTSMFYLFIVSLLLIYMLVAIPLKSYWQPIIIMSAIPFGLCGAILGHWFNDLPLGLLSVNGILALSGVVVNNSLLLTSRFNELYQSGYTILDAIVDAAKQRFRAIILTSATTYVGLISLLQETSQQAQYLIPAATSLAYGILFSTVITLVLVPLLLYITDDLRGILRLRHPNLEPLSKTAG